MNNIKVPDNFKHLTRKPMDRDPDSKVASIKNYIQNNPNKAISLNDFSENCDMSVATAGKYLKRLIRSGKVVKSKITTGKTGASFKYRWDAEGLKENQHRESDGVLVTNLNLPDFPLNEKNIHDLKNLFKDWCFTAGGENDMGGGSPVHTLAGGPAKVYSRRAGA